MKISQALYWSGLIAIIVIIVLSPNASTTNSITTITESDSLVPKRLLREYQMQIVDEHKIDVYDGERFVGSLPLDANINKPNDLDNLINLDNQ